MIRIGIYKMKDKIWRQPIDFQILKPTEKR